MLRGNAPNPAYPSLQTNFALTGWEEVWKKGIKPWDAGNSAPALVQLLEKNRIPEGKALVPGCGTVS